MTICYFPTIALGNEGDAKAAKVMMVAFRCSTYVGLAGKKEQQERLFKLGYDAGKQFLEAAQSGKITDAEIQAHVPAGVLWNLGGPSNDFVIGRMFESASSAAYDAVVKCHIPQGSRAVS